MPPHKRLDLLTPLGLAFLVAVFVAPPDAQAQPAVPPTATAVSDSDAIAPPDRVEPAPLVFNGDTIIVLRSVLAGRPPVERAAMALQRLSTLRPPGILAPVRIERYTIGRAVFVGDAHMFLVQDADADPRHVSVDATAEAARHNLERALAARALLWSPAARGRGLLAAAGATLVMLVLVVLVWRTRSALIRWLGSDSEWKRKHFHVGEVDLQAAGVAGLSWLIRVVAIAAVVAVLGLWLTFVLNRFPETQAGGQIGRSFLRATLGNFGRATIHALPGLFTAAMIFAIGSFVTRIGGDIFDAVERGRVKVLGIHPETASATRRIFHVLVWVFALVMAYPFLPGAQTEAFKGVSVLAGLLLTLGSAGFVGHMMSGLVLVYSRALRPGDYVRIGEVEGLVVEVGTLATKIANRKDEEFTIPNAVMVGTTIKNFSRLTRDKGAPLTTTVSVGYDQPWRVVHEILLSAAGRTAGLRQQPKPFVLQASLSDFAVEYQLVTRLEQADQRVLVLNELHQHIQDGFNERGVQIMSPHFEGQPDRAVLVPKAKWQEAPNDPKGSGTA